MFNKLIRPTDIAHLRKADLSDDGAELAACRGDAVACRAIAGREDLAGDDERCRVWAKVLEKIGEAVEEDERLCV